MQTALGLYFDPHEPDANSIVIEDIAKMLSHQCRFAGATKQHYSIAQHLVLCSNYADDDFKFEALLHDAHEAYTQDLVSPTKERLPDYKEMEDGVEYVIRELFELPSEMTEHVRLIDMRMLVTEKRDLLNKMSDENEEKIWGKLIRTYKPFDDKIVYWTPEYAEQVFLNLFDELQPD